MLEEIGEVLELAVRGILGLGTFLFYPLCNAILRFQAAVICDGKGSEK